VILWHITVEQRFQVIADSLEEAIEFLPEYQKNNNNWIMIDETIEKTGKQVIPTTDKSKQKTGDDND